MAGNYGRGLYKEYELLLTEKESLQAEYKLLKKEHQMLQKAYQLLQDELRSNEKMVAELAKKNAEIEAFKKEILRLTTLLDTDGTNSGIPTSKTPISKKKVIPNSRKKSGRKIGGQPGHPKKKLEAFADHEITETELHQPETCPFCGEQAEETEETIDKDELDYEVVVIKRRHKFVVYRCGKCGRKFHEPIPSNLKEDNQYGSQVRALTLSLMNIGNVSVNKVRKMIYGLSEEEINPSEGYIIKQQRKAAKELMPFWEELKKICLTLKTVYWDDTVIDINTRRGCLRFYGDEKIAIYTAHLRKNKEKGEEAFDDTYIKAFFEKFDQIMLEGVGENKEDYNKYYGKDERTLILRIFKYKDNYLSWVVNFDLPFSNNMSERGLRGAKSKMKISGQFQSEETAKHYAVIKSYIETCYRNGINETKALVRLCEGNPYTIKEVFSPDSGE